MCAENLDGRGTACRRSAIAAGAGPTHLAVVVVAAKGFDEIGGALVGHARGGDRFAGDYLGAGPEQQQPLTAVLMKLARERCELPAQDDSRSHRPSPIQRRACSRLPLRSMSAAACEFNTFDAYPRARKGRVSAVCDGFPVSDKDELAAERLFGRDETAEIPKRQASRLHRRHQQTRRFDRVPAIGARFDMVAVVHDDDVAG